MGGFPSQTSQVFGCFSRQVSVSPLCITFLVYSHDRCEINPWFVNKKLIWIQEGYRRHEDFYHLKTFGAATVWDFFFCIAACDRIVIECGDESDPGPEASRSCLVRVLFGIQKIFQISKHQWLVFWITWTFSTPGAEWSRLRFWDVILQYLLRNVEGPGNLATLSLLVWNRFVFWTKKNQGETDQHLTSRSWVPKARSFALILTSQVNRESMPVS